MHPDAETVLTGFKAFAEGDAETMRSLFHDDAVWHSAGRNRWSGDHQGADAIMELFGNVSSAAQITNELHGVLADDDHVVVLTKTKLEREGKSHESDGMYIFHVTDGKVSEAWAGAFDPYGTDDFWS
jgi:hypothetical protein